MHIIDEQLEALRPALKSERKARQLLEEYWSDKIPLIWTTEDVHIAANEIETVLTETQAREILRDLYQHHNAQYGLKWEDLTESIRQSGKGRDITKKELHRFIHKSVLITQKPEGKEK